MKQIIIAALTMLTLGATQAEYTVKIPLEQNQGGSLPSGTISIKNITPQAPIESWMPTTPFYTEWVNDGEPFDCTNWSPDANTVTIGQAFTQTATDCEQPQTRTRQEREQETTTLAYRDVGLPIIENQTIAATDTRKSIGSLIPANVSDKECLYNANLYNITMWDGQFKRAFWGSRTPIPISEVPGVFDGYRYTQGTAKDNYWEEIGVEYGLSNFFEICREPII